MRLDKFLCELNTGTRSQVRDYIRHGLVTVNGRLVKNAELKINENTDVVTYKGRTLKYREFVYYMLNKPKGVVSATKDNTADTVLKLIKEPAVKNLFPVGRLDKDTEGLLIITNDGDLAHKLLSPKSHVDKTYLVGIGDSLSEEDIKRLENGVDIGDDSMTLPAKVFVISQREILLTIHEGRFHQIKRMLSAVGNEVVSLKRTAFGKLTLDEALLPGGYRELNDREVELLHES